LLEWARQHNKSNRFRFNSAIAACGSAIDARPLFDVERRNIVFTRLAEQRASALSRKWGRWMMEFEPREDALRSAACSLFLIQPNAATNSLV